MQFLRSLQVSADPGATLLEAGRRGEAARQFEAALALEPGFGLARDALAKLSAAP